MPRLRDRQPSWVGLRSFSSWTWLALAWALLSIALWLSQQALYASTQTPLVALLDWQPALWQTQPWRWWTAALVHWSGAHLLLNLLGCVALLAWGNAAGVGARHTWAWVLAWPLVQGLLAASPTLTRFGGLSGVLHAGVAIGAWTLLWQGQGQRRLVGALVLAGLALKVFFEVPWFAHWLGLSVQALPLPGAPGFSVAGVAHLAGTVAGLACAVLVDVTPGLLQRKRRT